MSEMISVRVSEEVKEKFLNLCKESGLETNKDFLEKLIQGYEVQKAKEMPLFTQDISELEKLVARITSIYISMGERVETTLLAKDQESKENLLKKEEVINSLLGKIKTLEEINAIFNGDNQNLKAKVQEIEEINNEYKNKLLAQEEQFAEINDSNKALINEYRGKIDTLTGIVDEYKGYKTDIEGVKSTLEETNQNKAILEREKAILVEQVEKLQVNIADTKNKHSEELKAIEKRIESMEKGFEQEKEVLTNKLEVQKEGEILKLRVEHQKETEKIRNEKNDKIEALMNELEKTRVELASIRKKENPLEKQ